MFIQILVMRMDGSCRYQGLKLVGYNDNNTRTVPPVSRHWSCQSGESNLRVGISDDVQVGIILRPVNSMHVARKKGSPRCSVKLSFREFIKTVPNILQKLLQGRHLH